LHYLTPLCLGADPLAIAGEVVAVEAIEVEMQSSPFVQDLWVV
jgi:hypothetical protein